MQKLLEELIATIDFKTNKDQYFMALQIIIVRAIVIIFYRCEGYKQNIAIVDIFSDELLKFKG